MQFKKMLYRVTLPWGEYDEGNYCTKVWALNIGHALTIAAKEMVEIGPFQHVSDYTRKVVFSHFLNAEPCVVVDVAESVLNDVQDFLDCDAAHDDEEEKQQFMKLMKHWLGGIHQPVAAQPMAMADGEGSDID